jgi:MSHA biogenesis protein MshM
MYKRHFGLSGPPFACTPSPKLLFMSKTHREVRAALERSLEHESSGPSFIIGATGTGKTTLILSLLAQGRIPLRLAYVSHPKLGLDGLLYDIARQLGVPARTHRSELFRALGHHLDKLAPDERAVVIVDDAQTLSDEMLENLWLFSNRNLNSKRPLHFVFAGQPSLIDRLSMPGLRPVNERIDVSATLKPLEPEESLAYVNYRLVAFGGRAEALFAQGALDYLLARSGGIPRKINVFCHNALLRAHHVGEFRVSVKSAHSSAFEVEELLAGPHRHSSIHAVPHFVQRHFQALFSDTHGVAPAVLAALLAIAGIGSLHLWSSEAFRAAARVSSSTSGTVNDGVIEYPSTNDASKVTFPSERPTADAVAMTPASIAQDRPHPRQVRVRPGDTLLTIARAYLGSDQDFDKLISVNPQIGDINHIYTGEMLNLPTDASRPGLMREKVASEWQLVTPDMSTITRAGQ